MVKAGHDGAGRDAGGLGDFLIRKPLYLPQGKHGAVLGRQAGEGGADALDRLTPFGLLAGIVAGGRLGHSRNGGLTGVKGQETVKPAAALAQVIEAAPGDDGMKPGGEARVAAKGTQLLPDREPDFLADVAGIGFMVDDGIGQPESALMVRPHDDTEGRLIARLRAAKNIGVKVGGRVAHFGLTKDGSDRVGHKKSQKDTKEGPKAGWPRMARINTD